MGGARAGRWRSARPRRLQRDRRDARPVAAALLLPRVALRWALSLTGRVPAPADVVRRACDERPAPGRRHPLLRAQPRDQGRARGSPAPARAAAGAARGGCLALLGGPPGGRSWPPPFSTPFYR